MIVPRGESSQCGRSLLCSGCVGTPVSEVSQKAPSRRKATAAHRGGRWGYILMLVDVVCRDLRPGKESIG